MGAAGGLPQASEMAPASLTRRTGLYLAQCFAALGRATRLPPKVVPLWPAFGTVAIGVMIFGIIIGVTMLFADAWVYEHQRLLPVWLVDTFNEITDFGKAGWFLIPSGVVTLVLAACAHPGLGRLTNLMIASIVVRSGFLFVAIGLPSLLDTIVKRLIGRVRPSELGPFQYFPFSWRPDYAGMPSGHSTTAFAAAVAVGGLFPRLRPLMWLYAFTIATSRVVITAHYPSDVIAGAFVGGFGAILVRNWFAARRLGFVVAPDGVVRALPGPSIGRVRMVARRIGMKYLKR